MHVSLLSFMVNLTPVYSLHNTRFFGRNLISGLFKVIQAIKIAPRKLQGLARESFRARKNALWP